MASNTDTLSTDTGIDTGTVDRDARPPGRKPRSRAWSRGRRALPWVAVAAAAIATTALAVAVFTDDDDDAAPRANRAALQHEAERYVEGLESRATSVPAANRAALQHEAERYVEGLESRAASAPRANRAALQHEAERYVAWLESRAASISDRPTR